MAGRIFWANSPNPATFQNTIFSKQLNGNPASWLVGRETIFGKHFSQNNVTK
jgi:hypothetical protein